MSLWGFNPFNESTLCRSCSSLSRFPTPARVWGLAALLLVMVVEILLSKDLGLWEPRGFSWLFIQAALFLFVVFSSNFAGCLACRKVATALVP